MTRWINYSKITFLVLFLIGCVGVWTYQFMVAIPKKKCEAAAGWWYGPKRLCGTPILIERITGRSTEEAVAAAALKGAATPTPAEAAQAAAVAQTAPAPTPTK